MCITPFSAFRLPRSSHERIVTDPLLPSDLESSAQPKERAAEKLRIPSGSPIDNLLEGGIQTGLITHVYGCAGSGKTTFALQVSINAACLGFDVLYFDTEEGFPTYRLRQMIGTQHDPQIMRRIIVCQPSSFREQHECFLRLAEKGGERWSLRNLRVIVVDTIARHYRVEITKGSRVKVFRQLAEEQIPALLRTAREREIAVLVLNQVSSSLSGTLDFRAVGGDAVSRASRYEIKLDMEHESEGCRSAEIRKTPTLRPTAKKVSYSITKSGITLPVHDLIRNHPLTSLTK